MKDKHINTQPTKFVTKRINQIMYALPKAISITSILVLLVSSLLVSVVLFSIKIPIMHQAIGRLTNDTAALVKLSKEQIPLIHHGQRAIITIKEGHKNISIEGTIDALDKLNQTASISIKSSTPTIEPNSTITAVVSIQTKTVPLIAKIWN